MSEELAKAYEAKTVDGKWYSFWEEEGFFRADPKSKKPPYCIVIPPPNVTGSLHMGHALVNTLQDALIRWKRMSGYETIWVPGTDHAGISTQTVVEKHLMRTEGKKRKDYSREHFLERVWQWKEEKQDNILNQLRKMGCSCDWSRLRFTMDADNNRAVRVMFKKLYDAGLIYRGDYLVNWDPVTQTAIADDEVEYEERESFLWYIKYPIKGESGHLTIATTRPETLLGDTAVAVSSKDPRYSHLVGRTVILPLQNREIPVIADRHVDPQFGTGVVKVTPSHDPNDYQMGLAHNLPFINIMTPDGKINENGGNFAGLPMEEARQAVVKALQAEGLLEKIQPHTNRVGISYRSKAVVEPYMSTQWFVRMTPFAEKLRSAVADGKVKLIPKNWENTYFHWIDNLRDWCISRQLWWGHRIPIWYRRDDPSSMICHDGPDVPEAVQADPDGWVQDDDVLDTWFSSGLWPFATLGWPEQTPELKKFYPNAVLVTGHDILFFWVARMILMGEYAMGQVPFPETFLHGLIYGKSYWRNAPSGGISYVSEEERKAYELGKPVPKEVQSKWEKMSKSKGNIIDPLEIIESYGTDAMRMALCASATQAREIDLDLRRFEEFKNFANKVWNGARFVLMNLAGEKPLTLEAFQTGLSLEQLKLEDKWILLKLNQVIKGVNEAFATYQFDQAALQAYDFFWKDFCAYYVEIAKPALFGKTTSEDHLTKQKLLAIILTAAVRLLHPVAPFITEELFHILKERLPAQEASKTFKVDPYTQEALAALSAKACIVAPYPVQTHEISPEIEQKFNLIDSVVYTLRNIRGEMKLPPGVATDVHVSGNKESPSFKTIQENIHIIQALVKTKQIAFHQEEPALGFASTGMVDGIKLSLPLPEELIAQEKTRLAKEKEKLEGQISRLDQQLSNQEFVANAPPQLVEKQKLQKTQAEHELQSILQKLL